MKNLKNKLKNIKKFSSYLKKSFGKTNLSDIVPSKSKRGKDQMTDSICGSLDHYKNIQLDFAPPGHFYSPLPDLKLIKANEDEIFKNERKLLKIPAIDLNIKKQLEYFDYFSNYYKELPFSDYKDKLRYFYLNSAFSYADAISLYSMIRVVRPKRIIEIGSGYSSCIMLDTNDLFFDSKIRITFIEPNPELLLSLINERDKQKNEIIFKKLEETDVKIFDELEPGDILFIDSSHISKVNSDVNHIFFEILPRIKGGVFVHIHDVFYPFEYPKNWTYLGIAYNEDYILRAFLQYNNKFKIIFSNDFMGKFYGDKFVQNMPLFLKDFGSSFWMEKI